MGKITYQQAKELIIRGKNVKCQWGSYEDQVEIVKDLGRLDYCKQLANNKIRNADFYEIFEDTTPEECIPITFDEAYEMLYAKQKVFSKENGKEIEIKSIPKLMELRRQRGEKLLLYWYE